MKKFIKQLSAAALISAITMGTGVTTLAQTSHTVQPGEWLWDIARHYGLTAGDIVAANGLASEDIYPGKVLYIPGAYDAPITGVEDEVIGAYSGVHVVRPGDTLSGIAALYGLSVSQLQAWNGIGNGLLQIGDQIILYGNENALPPVSQPTAPTYSTNYYVQSGDTLSGLAYANGVSLDAIYAANPSAGDWLYVGQPLVIPGVAYPVAASTVYSWSEPVVESPSYQVVEEETTSRSTHVVKPVEQNQEKEDEDEKEEDNKEKDKDEETGPRSKLRVNGIRVSDLPKRARPEIHIVEADDDLEKIAEKYEITVKEIEDWNRLEADEEISQGRELFVSNPALVPTIHKVEEGESLYDIAEEYETTEQWIMHWNELEDNVPEINQLLIVSNPDPEIHEVEPGQALQDIADQYEISLEDLREWNGIPEKVTIVNGVLIVSDPRVGNEEELEDGEVEGEESTSDESTEESSEE